MAVLLAASVFCIAGGFFHKAVWTQADGIGTDPGSALERFFYHFPVVLWFTARFAHGFSIKAGVETSRCRK